MDLSEWVRLRILLFIFVVRVVDLALIAVVLVAYILFDDMVALGGVGDEKLDLFRRALLLRYENELDLGLFLDLREPLDTLEGRRYGQRRDPAHQVRHPEEVGVDGAENERVVRVVKLGIGNQVTVTGLVYVVLQDDLILQLLKDDINDEKAAIISHQNEILF